MLQHADLFITHGGMRAFLSSANKLYRYAIDVLEDNQIRKNALNIQQRIHNEQGVEGIAARIEEYLKNKSKDKHFI